MIELSLFDFIVLLIVFVVIIPMRYCFQAYGFTGFREYLLLCSIFVLGWLNMIFHALITHFDILVFHLIEYFTFIFMYYIIYLLGFTILEDSGSRKHRILFGYATIHIIYSLLLLINYEYWLSPNHLLLHLNGEIYRIGSGLFLIYVFNTIEAPFPSEETIKVTRLWKLVGVIIVILGVQTLITVVLLMIQYRVDLVTLNINLIGILALLMISIVSYIVLKYPTAFIISHTQVFKALKLYKNIDKKEQDEPSQEALMDYIASLSKRVSRHKEVKQRS